MPTEEPEIEGECILCGEPEHLCECQDCDCEEGPHRQLPRALLGFKGEYCEGCGGIVR